MKIGRIEIEPVLDGRILSMLHATKPMPENSKMLLATDPDGASHAPAPEARPMMTGKITAIRPCGLPTAGFGEA